MTDREFKIYLLVDGASKEELDIAEKIFKAITSTHVSNSIKEQFNFKSIVHDIKSYDNLSNTEQPCCCLIFGLYVEGCTNPLKVHITSMEDLKNLIPSKENASRRQETFKQLSAVGEDINKIAEQFLKQEKEPINSFIEFNGITIGLADTDILITEHQAEYLGKIRKLMGGGTMTITKGELRIEVEEKK